MNDRPTASTINDAQLDELYAEIARLRAGEEDGWDPAAYPTPGQWIARFNQATPQQRHDAAKHAVENAERASRCFLMDHAGQIADHRQARVTLARVREAIDSVKAAGAGHTPTTPYDKGVAAGVDWVTMRVLEAIDARLVNAPAPLTDADGRTVCTCTLDMPCGCGTSVHYQPKES